MTANEEHLNPSKLGTKEYWEHVYRTEKQNFTEDPFDEGQVWFSESDAEKRILLYLEDQELSPSSSFLDVGSGNGHLLFELLESDNYEDGSFVGIDYAVLGVELARRIAEERGVQEKVKFEVVDVIKDDMIRAKWVPKGGFDVVLDKGTFDAISLSDERLEDGRRIYEAYAEKIAVVVKSGGLLVVTSCNWTEEELKRKLLTTEGRFSNTPNFPCPEKTCLL